MPLTKLSTKTTFLASILMEVLSVKLYDNEVTDSPSHLLYGPVYEISQIVHTKGTHHLVCPKHFTKWLVLDQINKKANLVSW
jgi:hypothetical protein